MATQAWRVVVAYSLLLLLLECFSCFFSAFAPRTTGLIDKAAWKVFVCVVKTMAYPQDFRATWVATVATLGMVGIVWGILKACRRQWARTLQESHNLSKQVTRNLIAILWTCLLTLVSALGTAYNPNALWHDSVILTARLVGLLLKQNLVLYAPRLV